MPKTSILGANMKGEVRMSTENGGTIAENRALTDVNRRYFGICGRFSAVIDVNSGGSRQGIFHPIFQNYVRFRDQIVIF